jgi:membrane protein
MRAWWRRFWRRFGEACAAAYRDNCLGIAKGAAYSSLLAFFPVLTAIAAILVQANAEAVSRTLMRLLFEAVPPGAQGLCCRTSSSADHGPFRFW